MFTLDALRPFFSDPDANIRGFAARFAIAEGAADQALVPLLLAAATDLDGEDEPEALLPASFLPVSAEAARAALDLLAKEPGEPVRRALEALLCWAPQELAPELPDRAAVRVRRRAALCDEATPALLGRIVAIDARELEAGDDDLIADVAAVLAGRQDFDDDRVVADLGKEVEPGTAMTGLLIDLAKRRRLRAAVPALIEILLWDEEFAADDASMALGCIADPSTPEKILFALDSNEGSPTFAPYEALGRLHIPASERVLLELLAVVEGGDGMDAEWLLASLCQLGSRPGVEQAVAAFQAAESEGYGPDLFFIDELASALHVMGIPAPEALADAVMAQREQMGGMDGMDDGPHDEEVDEPDAPETEAGPNDDLWWDPDRPPAEPYRRETPKVGRNEPCPCGSGKKYKKCHG